MVRGSDGALWEAHEVIRGETASFNGPNGEYMVVLINEASGGGFEIIAAGSNGVTITVTKVVTGVMRDFTIPDDSWVLPRTPL